jgi:hypothetical protein
MGAKAAWSRGRRPVSALAALSASVAVGVAVFGSAPGASAVTAARTAPAAMSFAPTGAEQSYVVPANVALVETDVEAGDGGGGAYGMAEGGYLRVRGGERLYVEVGADGTYEGGPTFGGGGAAGAFAACNQPNPDGRCGGAFAGSGGGASDIRTCSETAKRCRGGGTSLDSRIIVAGGGGGQGGDGFSPGYYCTELPQKGYGLNRQALPGGTPANGPAPVQTAAGLVIPGEPANYSYGPTAIKDVTPSQGGAQQPGAGGTLAECDTYEVNNGSILADRFTGSIAGAAGTGATGGAGAAVAGHFAPAGPNGWLPGAGGGGGGGYTGGGGGSTGEICSYTVSGGPCYDTGGGMGGGGGASFFARAVVQPFIDASQGSGPAITFTPVVEIDRPKAGAVYRAGQRVVARWECGHYQSFSCSSATDASGQPIVMRRGHHTFAVKVNVYPDNVNEIVKISYTVR